MTRWLSRAMTRWLSHLLPYTVCWTDGRHVWEYSPAIRYPTARWAYRRARRLNAAASDRVILARELRRVAGQEPIWQWAEVRYVGRRAA